MSCVAVAAAVLVMIGASLTGVMVTVVVCVAHRSGAPPSHTLTSTTQLAGGVGPARDAAAARVRRPDGPRRSRRVRLSHGGVARAAHLRGGGGRRGARDD